MIAAVRERARRPLNVNVFCHQPAKADPSVESAWLEYLRPYFARFDAKPPPALKEIYRRFLEDDAMLAALLADKPQRGEHRVVLQETPIDSLSAGGGLASNLAK